MSSRGARAPPRHGPRRMTPLAAASQPVFRSRPVNRFAPVAVVFFLLAGVARGEDKAVAPVSSPTTVHVGVHLLRIDELGLKACTTIVTFYAWACWQGEVDGTAFEVMNGLEAKDSEYKDEKDGFRYAYYRCRATVNLDVDFRRFPFERAPPQHRARARQGGRDQGRLRERRRRHEVPREPAALRLGHPGRPGSP